MPNYYNKTTFERKDIAQELIDLWAATSNPKLAQYELTPPAPSPDAAWANGQWLTPPAPTFTAESWLDHQGYTPLRLLTCLDLEGKLRATGRTSPKLAATRAWLDALTLAAAVNPDAATSTWPPAPFAFDAVVQEAITQLQPI